ncbi:hypothetical protein H2199_004040 [Coniosporium tulheliwenetii]|uniref:Uncharacterized protein n=1 Tax=Coniosporium tulheliwenetii TaxID=3383036 RepID=A0ACC2Z6L8_9PEZI|nr:hypothetical protein H2199_004040 [Cladosporium sp. JES 115]
MGSKASKQAPTETSSVTPSGGETKRTSSSNPRHFLKRKLLKPTDLGVDGTAEKAEDDSGSGDSSSTTKAGSDGDATAHSRTSSSTTRVTYASICNERSNSPGEPPAPPPRLPSPPPVLEESPGKWGIRPETSITEDGVAAEQESDRELTKQTSGHFRGKSSTGFDIFKAASNRNSTAVAASLPTLQSAAPTPTIQINGEVTPPLTGSTARNSPTTNNSLTSLSLHNSTPISHTSASTLPSSPPEAGPTAGTLRPTPSNYSISASPASSIIHLPLPTRPRPAETNAPLVTKLQTDCYQLHRTFHKSKNVHSSIDCMLCYRQDEENRWLCSWCALRICGWCRAKVEALRPKRAVVMNGSGRSTPMSRVRS